MGGAEALLRPLWRGRLARVANVRLPIRIAAFGPQGRLSQDPRATGGLSFRLHAGLARQRRPFRNLRRHISSQFSRAVADDLGPLLAQPIANIR